MYVRSVTISNWSGLDSSSESSIAKVVAELMKQGPLASVFKCISRSEIELVAVALSAGKMGTSPFRYVQISAADLRATGLAAIFAEGRTCLPAANRLHHDLDLSGDRARRLVIHLATQRIAVETIRAGELREIAIRLKGAGHPIPADNWLLQ